MMKGDVRQVRVGTVRVGMIGLDAVFSQVTQLDLRDDELEDRLIALARKSNHIPASAEREYAAALLVEYRRFRGEDVREAGGMMEIRVLGPGCYQCDELMRRLRTVLAEMQVPADCEHIRDLGTIAEFGPMPTPGLIVNGKRVLAGRVPSISQLKEIIGKSVDTQSG